jgi:hypothetical protein
MALVEKLSSAAPTSEAPASVALGEKPLDRSRLVQHLMQDADQATRSA